MRLWMLLVVVVLWVAELTVPATSHAAGFAPRRGGAQATGKKGAKKQVVTSITFTSTIRGTVFEDGLFVGVTNQVVSLSPGTHRLSITAVGYPDIKRTVILRPGQQLKVPIVFKKPPPPKPKPTTPPAVAVRPVAPPPVATGSGTRRVSGAPKAKPNSFSKPRSSGMSYESDLPMGKETIQSQARRQTPPTVAAPAPSAPRYAPQAPQPAPTYQLSPPVQQPQPYYPQPAPQVYAPPPQPYYQPQPMYAPPPQPYYQPQPMYAPPPQPYYQPQPVMPQPMYAPPVPSYSSPMDTFSPVPLGSSGASSSRAPPQATKPKAKKRSAFLAIMPFGIGQFQNEQALKGAFFATTEAGCLIGAVVIMYQTRPYQEKISSGDEQYDQEQLKSFVAKQKQTQMYLYIGAGALWAIGVVDAFMNLDNNMPKQSASAVDINETPKPYMYSYGLGVHDENFAPALKFNLKF